MGTGDTDRATSCGGRHIASCERLERSVTNACSGRRALKSVIACSRVSFCSGGERSEENAFTGCSKRQQIVCRRKPKQIVRGLRRSSRLYVGPQRSALDYIIRLKRRPAKHNQGFDGSTSATEIAVNFKFGVQRVWFNLCKSGLRAAYRARVYRLEDRRLGSERRILKTHVRSLRPTRVRCGSRTLDQQIFLKLNRNTWALGFNVSNHPVSSNSNKESVQNCSHDLIVHRLWHTPYLPPVQRSTSEYKWGCGSIPREAHMKTCPDCNGDGVVEKGTDDEQQCPTCGGSGFVPDDDDGQEEVIHTNQPN